MVAMLLIVMQVAGPNNCYIAQKGQRNGCAKVQQVHPDALIRLFFPSDAVSFLVSRTGGTGF